MGGVLSNRMVLKISPPFQVRKVSIAHIKVKKLLVILCVFLWIVHEPSVSPIPHTSKISETIAAMHTPDFPRRNTGDQEKFGVETEEELMHSIRALDLSYQLHLEGR